MLDLPHGANLHGRGPYDRDRESHRNGWVSASWVSLRRGQIQERSHWPRPGDRSPRGGRRGYRPGMRTIGVGEVPLASSSSCSSLAGGGGDLSGLTEVLQPAGGVQPETGNTLDPSVDPETDLAAFLEEVCRTLRGCGGRL